MPWTVYAIFIVFGVFVILIIVDPRLSCFGRKIRSPFYPITRKKKQKQLQTQDYGFALVDEDMEMNPSLTGRKDHNKVSPDKGAGKTGKKELKTEDYGFKLGEKPDEPEGGDSA